MLEAQRPFFISLLAGTAAAWPLAALAQQSGRLRTMGFLGPNTHSAASEWVAALLQRLRELGWLEGRSITIEDRWAEGREERFAEIGRSIPFAEVNSSYIARGTSFARLRLR